MRFRSMVGALALLVACALLAVPCVAQSTGGVSVEPDRPNTPLAIAFILVGMAVLMAIIYTDRKRGTPGAT